MAGTADIIPATMTMVSRMVLRGKKTPFVFLEAAAAEVDMSD